MSNHRKNIRRQIKRATTWSQNEAPPTNSQARILSGLDVMRVLEDNAYKYLHDVLVYGPASFAGSSWAAALIWYRDKGYHNYKELTLFGLWAVGDNGTTQLQLGTKSLQFSAPVYNAESYNTLIRRGFRTYYGDDGSPPPSENITFTTTFDPTARLKLRQMLADEMIQWLRRYGR